MNNLELHKNNEIEKWHPFFQNPNPTGSKITSEMRFHNLSAFVSSNMMQIFHIKNRKLSKYGIIQKDHITNLHGN